MLLTPSNPCISAEFFLQTKKAALNLLGKELYLYGKKGIITEVESYRESQPSSHSFKGITPRNKPMFSKGGTIYVYSIHQCLCMNLAANKEGVGDAILIRGLWDYENNILYDGPGKLCKYLGVQRSYNFLTLGSVDLRGNTNYFITEAIQQKLVEIPYNPTCKKQQFAGNLVLPTLTVPLPRTNKDSIRISKLQSNFKAGALQATSPLHIANNAHAPTAPKLDDSANFKDFTNSADPTNPSLLGNNNATDQDALYYYRTPRIGLNPKNADYYALERFVLAQFSTKRVKLA